MEAESIDLARERARRESKERACLLFASCLSLFLSSAPRLRAPLSLFSDRLSSSIYADDVLLQRSSK